MPQHGSIIGVGSITIAGSSYAYLVLCAVGSAAWFHEERYSNTISLQFWQFLTGPSGFSAQRLTILVATRLTALPFLRHPTPQHCRFPNVTRRQWRRQDLRTGRACSRA